MRRVISLLPLVAAASAFTVLYIPLDERFTTRFAFLNLAQVTPFTVLTPPMDIISSERVPAPLDQLDAWVEANMPLADAAVISLELYVYGGLINSRISNDSSAFINSRVMKLVQLTQQYPNVAMHVAGVVMRIPSYSYSPPVEEPWYWAFYGYDLFTYSFYADKYTYSHLKSDLQQAEAAEALVPPAIVAEFVWRRARNYNATVLLLDALLNSTAGGAQPLFRSLYITQDDNAQYGFNIHEALNIKQIVANNTALQPLVKVYPGADEVGLSMLSRLTVDVMAELHEFEGGVTSALAPLHSVDDVWLPPAMRLGLQPPLDLVFRDPTNSSLYLIPNYEGQPMIFTLLDQIAAAGGIPVPNNWTIDAINAHAAARPTWGLLSAEQLQSHARDYIGNTSGLPTTTLLVNNFNDNPQIEAPNQPSGRSPSDYSMFTPQACGSSAAVSGIVSYVDNRYSNGGDLVLMQYLLQLAIESSCANPALNDNINGLSLQRIAYAGWNTDGNTLGDSISNAVVLHYFSALSTQRQAPGGSASLRQRLDALAAHRRAQAVAPAARGSFAARAAAVGASSDPVAPCTSSCANSYRILLRFVEDENWQADFRQQETGYIAQIDGENDYTLGEDLAFYEHYAFKVLASRTADYAAAFRVPWQLTSVYYPWNRTFEIGMFANVSAHDFD